MNEVEERPGSENGKSLKLGQLELAVHFYCCGMVCISGGQFDPIQKLNGLQCELVGVSMTS